MKIAIIGAGFSGLASCWHLSKQGYQCTLFDRGKEGASHVATGLLHPYVGKEAKRSLYADEAIADTKELLEQAELALGKPVASYDGIVRMCSDLETVAHLKKELSYDDVDWICPLSFLITSGITVYSQLYLKGLRHACENLGANIVIQEVDQLKELDHFDRVIIAAGQGIQKWVDLKELKLELLKGQVLSAYLKTAPEKSLVGSGYIGRTADDDLYCLGSTYERHFSSTEPDRHFAEKEIIKKLQVIYPAVEEAQVHDCKSGVRVCSKGHYLPLITKLNHRIFLFTGLGSRGLLYHAWGSKQLLNILR